MKHLKENYERFFGTINEAENKIADIRKILKTKKGKKIDSIFMDVETAEKVIKHYKSLKGSAKEKFVKQKIQNIVKSVNESTKGPDHEVVSQQDKMAKKLRGKNVMGYKFSIDSYTDNWNWTNQKLETEIYATPWDTLVANAGGNYGGPFDIVQVEVYNEDGDDVMKKDFRYVHSGNMSKDLNAYLKVIKTVILKSKLK